MDKQELIDEIANLEKERATFLQNAEKQIAVYEGAIQSLKLILDKYYNDNNQPTT